MFTPTVTLKVLVLGMHNLILTLVSMRIMVKLMQAAVTEVKILACLLRKSPPPLWKTVTREIR